ncbi:MAG: ThiF family adenylyltransferase [Phycisphaerales bacterium JB039]
MDPLRRYHRQTLLPGIGAEGQQRLGEARAALVGCGALGCAIADALVRAGVGRLTLIDRDIVELTNLQRQSLFTEADAAEGLPKAEAARRRLGQVNSHVAITSHVADFAPAMAERLAGFAGGNSPQVLLDGTDNFETRLLLNDLAVKHGIPLVYGGAVATRGMMAVILPGDGPCLRCILPEPPPAGSMPTCDTAGVLGPVATIVGAAQAAEAIKLLVGAREQVSRTMLDFDVWRNVRRRLDLGQMRNPECPCCVHRQFDWLHGRRDAGTTSLCGRSAIQVAGRPGAAVDLAALGERLGTHGAVQVNPFLMRAVLADERREEGAGAGPVELTVFADGRAIVAGVTAPARARAIYAKYIGA